MIIYKTTNLINGKIYIGKDAHNRRTYLGSGNILRRAIAKYGKENFRKEVLEICSSLDELSDKEKYWISKLNTTDLSIGYNLTEGGSGGDTYSFLDKDRKEKRRLELRQASLAFLHSDEGRKFLSENSKKMWENPIHRKHMVDIMKGRNICWADKISKSITEWHKTNPIPETSKRRAAKIVSEKMRGREFKSVTDEIKDKIISLYEIFGPKLISVKLAEEGIEVSRYIITRVLKKERIYQKWQKGIGEKSEKHASISKRGDKNPMFKRRT